MSLKLVKVMDTRNQHECCMCGKWETWNENWAWYGSYRDIGDGKKIYKACSETCRDKFNKEHRIPHSNREVVN